MNRTATQTESLASRLRANWHNNPMRRYPDLGLICLGIFIMLIGVGAIVPIRTIYARDRGANPAELGLMASAFMLGAFIMQLPGGLISDKWGRKPLLVLGIAVTGVISFMFLLWDQPWYFIALRFTEGAASGAINPAANAYVMDTVPVRERGAAFGWLGSAFSAGFMLGPAIGGIMGDAVGFEAPFIFGGVSAIATALLLSKKMRNYKPGQSPLPLVEAAAAGGEADAPARKQIPHSLLRPALVGAIVLITAGGIEDGLFVALWTIWLNDLHASNTFIGLTFIVFSIPLVVLMPLTGRWSDKLRLAPLIAIPAALVSFIYLLYGLTDSLPLIAGLGLVEGVLLAVRLPATTAYIANLSPDNARGRIQGITLTTRTIAGFISSMVVMMLYYVDRHYPFFMLAGTQITVSIIGGLLIWRIERRSAAINEASNGEPASPLLRTSGATGLDSAAK